MQKNPDEEILDAARTNILDCFKSFDIESFQRNDLGDKLSFNDATSLINSVVSLYLNLLEYDSNELPLKIKSTINDSGYNTIRILNSIKDFDLDKTSPDPFRARDQIIEKLEKQWEKDFKEFTPVIAYILIGNKGGNYLINEARKTLQDIKESEIEFKEIINRKLKTIDSTVLSAQNAANISGIGQHAIHFSNEAKSSKYIAIFWLVASVILGCLAIYYIIDFIEPTLSELSSPTAAQLIQAAIPRMLIIFILTFGMIWSAKNFTSNAHNYVVNRHRQNALGSFQTFVEGTSSIAVKDAVLMQATHAIFTPQESGFAKGEIQNPSSHIIEVFKGLRD